MKKINLVKLIISLIICQLAGVIGSIFTIQSVTTWYVTLNKPIFTPSGSFIGFVWTILFFLMGYSLYLVWNKNKEIKGRGNALIIFTVQLFLNILWSFCFFYLQSTLKGLIEIIFLWLAILLTIIYFYKISKVAAYLLIPYILWVSFAAILNYLIYHLN